MVGWACFGACGGAEDAPASKAISPPQNNTSPGPAKGSAADSNNNAAANSNNNASSRQAPYKLAGSSTPDVPAEGTGTGTHNNSNAVPPSKSPQGEGSEQTKPSDGDDSFAKPSERGSNAETNMSSSPAPVASVNKPIAENDEDEATEAAERADVLHNSPGFLPHSLKLLHDNTLSKQNISLCRPQDLVSDIKEMCFIGNGSFAAVFKGEDWVCESLGSRILGRAALSSCVAPHHHP